MRDPHITQDDADALFHSAKWYDRSIRWSARLERELPLLVDWLRPPAEVGLIDAGCGTGHQALALAERGYRVVGVDASAEMLEVARERIPADAPSVEFTQTSYATMSETIGGGFDGLYCLGNALSAAGSRDAVEKAIEQFGACLRTGGRLFVQILNFPLMRREKPCVRGPRVSFAGKQEYISVRQFHFGEDHVIVTNVTLWHDDTWHQRAHSGRLYPLALEQLRTMCKRFGFQIDHTWGSYAKDAFQPDQSTDLLIAATRL